MCSSDLAIRVMVRAHYTQGVTAAVDARSLMRRHMRALMAGTREPVSHRSYYKVLGAINYKARSVVYGRDE